MLLRMLASAPRPSYCPGHGPLLPCIPVWLAGWDLFFGDSVKSKVLSSFLLWFSSCPGLRLALLFGVGTWALPASVFGCGRHLVGPFGPPSHLFRCGHTGWGCALAPTSRFFWCGRTLWWCMRVVPFLHVIAVIASRGSRLRIRS